MEYKLDSESIRRYADSSFGEPYRQPTSGFMSYIPSHLLPVAQLIRLDKPGFVYFFVPMLCGALQGATLQQGSPSYTATTIFNLLLLSIPVTFINYSWNDTVDAKFDAQVRRTQHRPIARGALSLTQAYAINFLLLMTCLAFLLKLFPIETFVFTIPCWLGSFIYPLSKRVFMFPQLVFGFVMAAGILVGGSAVGVTPFVDCTNAHTLQACVHVSVDPRVECMLWLYAANVAWCVCYEIVYSFQDVADDERAGVGTITLLIRENPKPLLVFLAILQTVLFAFVGIKSAAGPLYYFFSVGIMALSMVVKLKRVDLEDPESCIWWFSKGALITGGSIAMGLFADYYQTISNL